MGMEGLIKYFYFKIKYRSFYEQNSWNILISYVFLQHLEKQL